MEAEAVSAHMTQILEMCAKKLRDEHRELNTRWCVEDINRESSRGHPERSERSGVIQPEVNPELLDSVKSLLLFVDKPSIFYQSK